MMKADTTIVSLAIGWPLTAKDAAGKRKSNNSGNHQALRGHNEVEYSDSSMEMAHLTQSKYIISKYPGSNTSTDIALLRV